MAPTRRAFLGALGAGAAALAAPALLRPASGRDREEVYLSASDSLGGAHFITAVDAAGAVRFSLPISDRGHAVVVRPGGREALVVGRLPGKSIGVLDLAEGRVVRNVEVSAGRLFYGHGCFTADGRTLFTTENDYERGAGVVAIRDASDGYKRAGEFDSRGVGPHDMALLADGRTVVVANGGIRTHPSTGRRELNLDTMDPSLAYLDAPSGKLLGRFRAPNPKSSLRHLAVAPDDTVVAAIQHHGPDYEDVPLIAVHRGEDAVRLLPCPQPALASLNRYTASVALHAESGVVCATCPKGDAVAFWSLKTGEFLKTLPLRDAGGIAVSRDRARFVVTSGAGDILRVDPRTLVPDAHPLFVAKTRWDNHVASATIS